MKRLSWILTLPLTLLLVVFAVANRQMVALDLWPFEMTMPPLPLSAVVLLSLFFGLLAGGAVTWLSAARSRQRAREAQHRAARLEREVARLRRDFESGRATAPPGLPQRLPPAAGPHGGEIARIPAP